MSTKVIVNYKKPGATIHCFWKKVPTKENPMAGELVRMVTGINHMDSDFLDSLVGDIEFDKMLDEGIIEIIAPEKDKEKAAGLGGYSEKKSLTLVKGCFDQDTLKNWLDVEERSPVRRELENQIDLCTAKKKK
jgi:hypothetical protein